MLAQQDGVSGTSTIASVTLAASAWLPQANVTLVGAFADCPNPSYLHLILETAKFQKHIFFALRTSRTRLVV